MLRLVVESWIWYSVAVTVALCRFISRTLLFGSVKKLQTDDWAMGLAISTYTALLVSINLVANASSNLLPPGFDISTLTPDEIADREYGSKMVLVVEQMQCATIWTLKACLLIMYYRLTVVHRREHVAVIALAAYTALAFVVMEILYLGVWCTPFYNYWRVPSPNIQCTAATNHLIVNATFNITSDLIMLTIGLSLFIRSHLPLQRKLILCCIFGLGVFVILSAVLNKYYSFTQPFGSLWTFWYVRESSTALLVANLPFTWTLLRRIFKLRAFDPSRRPSNQYHSQRTATGRRTWSQVPNSPPRGNSMQGAGNMDSGHGSNSGSVEMDSNDASRKEDAQPDTEARKSYGRAEAELLGFAPCDAGWYDPPIERAMLANQKDSEGVGLSVRRDSGASARNT